MSTATTTTTPPPPMAPDHDDLLPSEASSVYAEPLDGLNLSHSVLSVIGPRSQAGNDNRNNWLAHSLDADDEAQADRPLSVMGRTLLDRADDGAVRARRRPDEIDWRERSEVQGLARSTCIPLSAYDEAQGAFTLCRESFREIDTFLTIRPYDFDVLDPVARLERWDWYRNKLQALCRRLGFDFTAIMVRESCTRWGDWEHSHVLMWVPPQHREDFDRVVAKWAKHKKHPADIDMRRARSGFTYTRTGKRRSVIGYATKNAPPQARRRDKALWYQAGGAVWGWRCKVTRNVNMAAQEGFREMAALGTIRPGIAAAGRLPLALHPANMAQDFAA